MVGDDPAQEARAKAELADAEMVALGSAALCEAVWVLNSRYRRSASEIAAAIRDILEADNVVTDRPSIEAGLAMLEAGGYFADGVIAHEGAWLGGEPSSRSTGKQSAFYGRQGMLRASRPSAARRCPPAHDRGLAAGRLRSARR